MEPLERWILERPESADPTTGSVVYVFPEASDDGEIRSALAL
jgi:hypothetical protein